MKYIYNTLDQLHIKIYNDVLPLLKETMITIYYFSLRLPEVRQKY